MITTYSVPTLVDSDPVSAIRAYSEQIKARLSDGSGTVPLTLLAGWNAVTGYSLYARRFGALVEVRGMVNFASGQFTNPIAKLPTRFLPTSNIWLNTCVLTASKGTAQIMVGTDGNISIPSAAYYSGTPKAGDLVAVSGVFMTLNPW